VHNPLFDQRLEVGLQVNDILGLKTLLNVDLMWIPVPVDGTFGAIAKGLKKGFGVESLEFNLPQKCTVETRRPISMRRVAAEARDG